MGDLISVVVRRLLPAPPDVVYDEWLDADALADWMCPRPAQPTKVECDPRVGGVFRLDIDETGRTMVVTGRYLELVRPRLLRFTWYCSTWRTGEGPDDPDSIVSVTLEPHGPDGTWMTIEHTALRADVAERHRDGWTLIAEQLVSVLAGRRG
jgi:uncharacterized protein YndB with AHSA1/START domain